MSGNTEQLSSTGANPPPPLSSSSLSFRLYALGSNSSFQLGLPHGRDVWSPEECLFDSGDYPAGDQGLSSSSPKESLTEVGRGDRNLRPRFRKLVAGGNHTLVLLEGGEVYATGENGDGRCGLIDKGEGDDVDDDSRSADGGRSGGFRRVVLRDRRRGPGGDGEDGDDDEAEVGISIVDIAATWSASFLLDEQERIWVCGSGEKGELGLGEEVRKCKLGEYVLHLPVPDHDENKRDARSRRVFIRAGMGHVALVASNGAVYGWGAARKGQLGPEAAASKDIWRPSRLVLPFQDVVDAHVGRNFTLFLGENSQTCLWGTQDTLPASISGLRSEIPAQYGAGWSHIFTLADGKLDGFGPGNKGQVPSETFPNVKVFAAGSEHCVAITAQDKVITWGWGEHGNCGLPVDVKGIVTHRWNVIPLPLREGENIVAVAAGCATTFVVVEQT